MRISLKLMSDAKRQVQKTQIKNQHTASTNMENGRKQRERLLKEAWEQGNMLSILN